MRVSRKVPGMHLRPGRLALFVFQAIWFAILLPSHARGMITLPGSDAAAGPTRSSCCQSHDGKHSQGAPSDDRAGRCAICFFAARITPPPVVDFTLPPHSFLFCLNVIDSSRCDQRQLQVGFDTRAPPVA
jgi:hypothetical protein